MCAPRINNRVAGYPHAAHGRRRRLKHDLDGNPSEALAAGDVDSDGAGDVAGAIRGWA